jgi:hypothetical protein
MKKSILLIGNLFVGVGFMFAQTTPVSQSPQNKNVVLEELTGINCQYCPDGHKRAQDISNANPGRVILVNVHAGGFAPNNPNLKTTDGDALDVFLEPEGYPAGSVQRTKFGSETFLATSRANWTGQVSARLAEVSPVNVAMNATLDAATRQLTINVEMFYTTPEAAGTMHYLNVGILQNNWEGPQVGSALNPGSVLPNGNYLHQHIFRGFINAGGTWGEAIDASQTGVITKTITYTLPASLNGIDMNLGELEFFAFVHKGQNTVNDSQILSGAKVLATVTNVPGATVSAESIINTMNVCAGETVSPVIKVKNTGDVVSSIAFSSSINGGTPVPYTWNGTLGFFQTEEITLPAMSFTPGGTNSVVVTVTSVNGGAGSVGQVASQTKPILIASTSATNALVVKVTTDQYGSETRWKLLNDAGATVASGGPYTDAAASGTFPQPDVNVNAPNGCYTLEVTDSYGDGFDSGYGNGKVEVLAFGSVVANIDNFPSGSLAEDAMSVDAVAGVEMLENAFGLNVYPNPASDVLNVEFNASNGDNLVTLLDLQGRVILTKELSNVSGTQTVALSVSEIAKGSYIVKIAANGVSTIQNVVIK